MTVATRTSACRLRAIGMILLFTGRGVTADPPRTKATRPAAGQSVASLANPKLGEAVVVELVRHISEAGRRHNEVLTADGRPIDLAESVRANIRARFGDRTPPPDDPDVVTLKLIEKGEIWTSASSGRRTQRERWFIASDGRFRFDLTEEKPNAGAEPVFKRTFTCIPAGSAARVGAPGMHELDWARRLYSHHSSMQFRLCDFSAIGGVDFEQPVVAAAIAAGQRRPEDGLRVSAVSTEPLVEGGPSRTVITVDGTSGKRVFELVVDAAEPSRCLESRVYDEFGQPARTVLNRDFRATPDCPRKVPHEVEMTDYKQGQVVRVDRLEITRIAVDAKAVEDALREGAQCPEGWTRADHAAEASKR